MLNYSYNTKKLIKFAITIVIVSLAGCFVSENITSDEVILQYQRPDVAYSNTSIIMYDSVSPGPTKREEIASIEGQKILYAVIIVAAILVVFAFTLGFE